MKHYLSRGLIIIAGGLAALTAYDQMHKVAAHVIPVQSTGFMPEENVFVTAKAYNGDESKLYLSHDLISRGVQPLEISIHNHSAQEYSLCASSVDLPSVDPSEAAFAVTKGAIPRGIAWRLASFVGSLFFWPISIPCAVDGIRTFTHHKNLKTDFLAKSLKKGGEVVAPYATYHRILFVPKKEIQKSFKVTLINLETYEQTEFQVETEGLSP
jgi:hypothetical protein